jgi:hypothetical protein
VLGKSVKFIEEMDERNREKLPPLTLYLRKFPRYLRKHSDESVDHFRTASLVVCQEIFLRPKRVAKVNALLHGHRGRPVNLRRFKKYLFETNDSRPCREQSVSHFLREMRGSLVYDGR